MPADSPAARLATLYNPDFLRDAGERLGTLLAEHFRAVQNRDTSVLNWRHPAENVAEAGTFLDMGTLQPALPIPDEVANRFAVLIRKALERGQNLHSPRYVGHQVPPPIPIAGLFDAVSAATNQPMAIYEMGPWATAIESALVERLGGKLGYAKGSFAGFVTHGGSLANMTALLTARNVAIGDAWEAGVNRNGASPVLVAHGEAHYCIGRSAGILGLGTRQIVKAELDDRRRIDPVKLDQLLTALKREARLPIAVAASSCATPIGAFDSLEAIADVCEKHGVWLHVDAAHGGAAIFSEKHRHLLSGIERADSVVWDAHKMMHVPALCTFVFYKNPAHRFEAFRQDAPYLFDPSDPGLSDYDSGLKTLECTKRGAAFGLWGIWSLFGESIFSDLIDVTFELAQNFYQLLSGADDFAPLHKPQCNIQAFRHVPDELKDVPSEVLGRFQLELRKDIVRSGAFYLVPTTKDGVAGLRCTIINPLTTPRDLAELLNELRDRGKAVLQRMR